MKKIGILNTGKDNTFKDCEFENLDVGIQDEGSGTLATGNKFTNTETQPNNENVDPDKQQDDIIELKPNVFGFGVNLRAWWRNLKNK